jgi:hypothetical protein
VATLRRLRSAVSSTDVSEMVAMGRPFNFRIERHSGLERLLSEML